MSRKHHGLANDWPEVRCTSGHSADGRARTPAAWPDVPWGRMKWGIIVMTLIAPVITYPYPKSVWLALDLVFRPATLQDFNPGSPDKD